MCCDCCLLGKAAQEQGLPCDHSLTVGYQCGLVSRACCVDGAPDNQTAPAGQTECGCRINNHAVGDSFLTFVCIKAVNFTVRVIKQNTIEKPHKISQNTGGWTWKLRKIRWRNQSTTGVIKHKPTLPPGGCMWSLPLAFTGGREWLFAWQTNK